MGSNSGNNGITGSDALIEGVIGDITDSYGDTYPSELYDETRRYLDDWLKSRGGKGGRRTEDVSSLPDTYREPVAFAAAQSYMLGYASGLDGDYIPDMVTVDDIAADMDSDPSAIKGMAECLSDVYPSHIIVRAAAHCATVMDRGLNADMHEDDEDDDEDAAEETEKAILAIVRACFKAFCLGCNDGEAALAAGRTPDIETNDDVLNGLIVSGCLTAINVTFGNDDDADNDGTKSLVIASISDANDDEAEPISIAVPPDVAAKGTFSYDTESGKVTYTFDADDVPDFMNGVNASAAIVQQIAMYAMQKNGYYDGLSDDDIEQIRDIIDDSQENHDTEDDADGDDASDGDIVVGPRDVYELTCTLLPALDGFIRSNVIHPSGVYEDGYMESAVMTVTSFVASFLQGFSAALSGDANTHDVTLPDGIPFDTEDALRIARDKVSGWCMRNGVADWAYVATIVNLVDTYLDSKEDEAEAGNGDSTKQGHADAPWDDDADADDGTPLAMVGEIALLSRMLVAVGIGFACGIISSGIDNAQCGAMRNVSWV